MKRVPLDELCYEFSRHRDPRLRIEPGESIVVESEDAFSGQIRTTDDRRDRQKMPYSNPLTGPIFVSGAVPGDALAVTIVAIQPTLGQCVTYLGPPKQLGEWLGADQPHGTRVCPIRDGQIHWSGKLTIPYRPMLGCIGTTPDWGAPTTLPAGAHGGNMDIQEVGPGATIYLPVFVEGAYLYLGDAHAAQGDGELTACGLEMAAETTIRIDVVKNKKLLGPRVETADEIMTVVSGCPMERSVAEAYARLILWMEADYGWDRWQAYDLLTHVGRISVGYYAIGTVAAKIEKRYLNQYA